MRSGSLCRLRLWRLILCLTAAVVGILSFESILLGETLRRILSEDAPIGVIHLGKCNGIAMGRTVKRKKMMSVMARRGFKFYHMRPPPLQRHKEWVALVRDPIDRFISIFLYEHPKNAIFRKDPTALTLAEQEKLTLYNCFDTIDDLATIGLGGTHENDHCTTLANNLFSKVGVPGMPHATFNFAYYYEELLKQTNDTMIPKENKTISHIANETTVNWSNETMIFDGNETIIYVVRNEFMVSDLNTIDAAMGGTGTPYTKIFQYSHYRDGVKRNELPVISRWISLAGQKNLCNSLCSEIQIYKQLLEKAVNLRDGHKEYTLRHLHERCPKEVELDACLNPAGGSAFSIA